MTWQAVCVQCGWKTRGATLDETITTMTQHEKTHPPSTNIEHERFKGRGTWGHATLPS